ncbi:uncharacterized protein L201_007530 [Kwoniella dendrophila CBS 6074]|uniref:Uncharacterized protein n=1 Tax=Kwoniella dendrophila CBS 6074 TaxID=1295534 RepID=A0AAX4K4N3_9TREE
MSRSMTYPWDLRPAEMVTDFETNMTDSQADSNDFKTIRWTIKCPTSKLNCSNCGKDMDVQNPDYQPKRSDTALLFDTGLNMKCLNPQQARGSSYLTFRIKDSNIPFIVTAGWATVKDIKSVRDLTEQHNLAETLRYTWADCSKAHETLDGRLMVDDYKRLNIYPVSVGSKDETLFGIQEKYLKFLASTAEFFEPSPQNPNEGELWSRDATGRSVIVHTSYLAEDNSQAVQPRQSRLSRWKHFRLRKNESIDPRTAIPSAASQEYIPRIAPPWTHLPPPPANTKGMHEMEYNPTAYMAEMSNTPSIPQLPYDPTEYRYLREAPNEAEVFELGYAPSEYMAELPNTRPGDRPDWASFSASRQRDFRTLGAIPSTSGVTSVQRTLDEGSTAPREDPIERPGAPVNGNGGRQYEYKPYRP